MREGGSLASTIGRVLGTGAGRGIGLIMVCLGMFQVLATLIAWRSRSLRNIECDLPDASGSSR
jgi:MFS transporter, DHA3 family, macrolide efflux protein